MAIGPKQLNDSFLNEVSHYEERIDSSLANRRISPVGSTVVDVPRGMTYDHFKILKERYLKAGWSDVKWNSDQREGEWLSFDSKPKLDSNNWTDK